MSESSYISLPDYWYPVAFSHELRTNEVRQIRLLGVPYALFRNATGKVGILEDRCPHRNVPLSDGSCEGQNLRCVYHGWSFSTEGECVDIPCLQRSFDGRRRAAHALPAKDDGCLIWAWPGNGIPAETPRSPRSPAGDYSEVLHRVSMPGPLPAVIENALDVPHTRFLHGGLFRDDSTSNEISVHVSMDSDSVEAQYKGEPRPGGLAGKFLAPGGGVVEHWDRFVMPSTAEVEYKLGADNHILISTVCSPVSGSETELFAVVRYKTRLPDRLLRPVFMPLVRRILAQDADILAAQEANIREFSEERFTSTELDAIGPRALYIMRAASRGEAVKPNVFAPVQIFV